MARKQQSTGLAVVSGGLGLARIGAGTLARTAGWGVTQYSKGARRLIQAAVDPIAATELADDVAKVTGEVAEFARAVTAHTPLAGVAERVIPLIDRAREAVEQYGSGEEGKQSEAQRLRRAGEDLLRRSRDVWHEEERHPAFAGILQSLAPDEARLLVLLLKEGPHPIVDVVSGPANNRREIAANLSMLPLRASVRYAESVPAYLHNLSRLGLLWQSDEAVDDLVRYQVVEAQPEVLEALKSVRRAKVVRRSVHLTPFGVDFASACFADDQAVEDLPTHDAPPPEPKYTLGE